MRILIASRNGLWPLSPARGYCWGSLPPEAPYPEVTGAPATTTNPFHNLRLVCRSFCWFTGRRSLLKVHSRKGPIEGPLVIYERRSKTRRSSILSWRGVAEAMEHPRASRNLRRTGGGVPITTRRSLRDVNVSSTKKREKTS